MGLLSSFVTAITPTKAKLKNVVDVLSIALNPFTKDKISANINQPVVKSVVETVATHPYTSAGLIAGGVTAVSNPQAAGKVLNALTPTSTLGKVAGIAAVPVVAGAVLKQPAAAAKAVASTPGALVNFGGNVSEFVANPSLQTAKNIVSENPVIAGVVGTAGALALGRAAVGVGSVIASSSMTSAIKEQTAAILGGKQSQDLTDQERLDLNKALGNTVTPSQALPVTATPISATSPVLPATQTVSSSVPSKRKRKQKRKIEAQNISQRVNVLINSGKFINKRSYKA